MTGMVASDTGTRLTTVWGGIGILAASALMLATQLAFVTLDGTTAAFGFRTTSLIFAIIPMVAPLVLAGAVYILAFGIRDENGLVGDSRAGRIAVIVFVSVTVLRSLIRLFFVVVPVHVAADSMTVPAYDVLLGTYVQPGLGALALASLIVAVVVVVRRGAGSRSLRWGLVIVMAWTMLAASLWFSPIFLFVGTFIPDVFAFGLLLQAALGAMIALHGQSAALRRRAAIINEHW